MRALLALILMTTGAVAAPALSGSERVAAEVQTNFARTALGQRVPNFGSAEIMNVYATITSAKDPTFGGDYAAYAVCGTIRVKDPDTGAYSHWSGFAVVRDAGPVAAQSIYFDINPDEIAVSNRFCNPIDSASRFDRSPRYTAIMEGKLRPGQTS